MPVAGEPAEAGLPLPAPAGPSDLSDHYDLTMSHPAVDAPQFAAFDRWLSRAAHDLDLSCALIHDPVVHETIHRLGAGRLTVGYHLDYHALWHVADDPYARLAEAVVDAGGRSVNPPTPLRRQAPSTRNFNAATGDTGAVILRPRTADRTLTVAARRHHNPYKPRPRLRQPANGSPVRRVA